MARKAKKKSIAKKITKRAAKKPKRFAAIKTMLKKVVKKPRKAKAAKAGKPTRKSVVKAAATSIEDMPCGDGYFIPYEKLVSP